ncbi:MAG: hypothetical protein MUF22_03585 [Chitinispirillaceae bacterium]|jgi:hypothetical protein|nr:hypothetical protein [Chitinispirillaceae bacterium]
MTCSAVQLSLFKAPSFDELLSVAGLTQQLSVTVSPRLRTTWQTRTTPLSGRRHLSIPLSLENAPEEIKMCLIDWALLPFCSRASAHKKTVRRKRRELEKIILRHMASLPGQHPKQSRFDPGRFSENAHGRVYDLAEVFDSVNRVAFCGKLQALVRWGKDKSRTSCHTVKTDRQGRRVNCITIAGVYNRKEVPRCAIEGVMHHEMLHIAVPPYERSGRRVVHGREFKHAEKNFPQYAPWRRWEQKHLVRRRTLFFWG